MSDLEDFHMELEGRLNTLGRVLPDGTYQLYDDYQDYQAILKLHEMLDEHEIPHCMRRHFDGWIILYPVEGPGEGHVCSCIQHCFSYGALSDRLEIMGLLTAEEAENGVVCGYLTAEDVFNRIKAHWGGLNNELSESWRNRP